MDINWIPFFMGVVAIIGGILAFRNRVWVWRTIAKAQRNIIRPLAATKEKPASIAVASIGIVFVGALLIVFSVVSIFRQR